MQSQRATLLDSLRSWRPLRKEPRSDVAVDDYPGNPKYVLLLVLSQDCERVLTVHIPEDKENSLGTLGFPSGWYLPRFAYDPETPYQSSYCVRDLQRLLDPHSQNFCFTVVAELLPRQDDTLKDFYNPNGMKRITLVDMQQKGQFEDKLPSTARWSHVKHLVETVSRYFPPYYEHEADALCFFLHPYTEPTAARAEDRRCSSRWIYRAPNFLVATIRDLNLEPICDVERVVWSSASHFFRVKTREGWYFLKAPPPGCAEMLLTQKLSELFPDDLPSIVGMSESLGCFVSKGIYTFIPPTAIPAPVSRSFCSLPAFMLPSTSKILGSKIARIQLQSIKYLEELKDLGVQEYSPGNLASCIDAWISDPVVLAELERTGYDSEEFALAARTVCTRLAKSSLPLTLVHGDFALRNCGIREDIRRDNGLVVFDWGKACITHPFAEFRFRDSKARSKHYRKKWQKFITNEEIDLEMKLGEGLGCLVALAEATRMKTLGCKQNRHIMEFCQGGAVTGFLMCWRSAEDEIAQLVASAE